MVEKIKTATALEFKYRPFVVFFVSFMFVVFAGLIAAPLHEHEYAEHLFANTSIYFFNAMVVAWVYCFLDWRKTVFSKVPFNTMVGALFFCFLLTTLVWFGVEHSFKVLSDESNLVAISRSLMYEKTAYNHTMGRWYYDNFWPLTSVLDKRPILFPYLLQLVHVVLGYSVDNVYILNSIFLFLFLYLIFLLVYPLGGFLGGLAGMLFVLAQPILSDTAISGGFDLQACLLQFWVAYLVLQLCERENPTIRPLLWYSLVLLVHARYENMLAFPLVLSILWIFGKFPLSELKKHPYLYSMSLIFLLPRIWLLILPQNYESPPGVPVIGWMNFVKHLPVFLQYFVDMSFTLPYATILNVAAVILGLVWVGFFLRKRTSFLDEKYFPFALVILGFAFSELTITLSHHFGVFNHPTQARLFLVFVVTLSLAPFLLKGILGKLPSKILLLVSTILFLIYFPIAEENRFVNQLTIIRKTRWAYNFFDNLKNNQNILIIVDRPGIYSIRPTGAIDFNWARQNKDMILTDIQHRLYDDVYLVEDIEYKKNKSELADIFELETVFRRQNTPTEEVRISKLVHPKNLDAKL